MSKIKEHLDKVGFLGSLFAALCCIGTPALLAFLGAIGVGFLINDAILIPFLLISLGLTIWGLLLSLRIHKRPQALILSIISSIIVFSGIWISKLLVYLGLIGLLGSSIWNIVLKKQCSNICED